MNKHVKQYYLEQNEQTATWSVWCCIGDTHVQMASHIPTRLAANFIATVYAGYDQDYEELPS